MGVTSDRLPHKGRLLAVLLMGPFMAQADATIANVATPSTRADLGASGAALELVVGGYMIAFATLLITGARLGQTHGYRRIFVLGRAEGWPAWARVSLAASVPALALFVGVERRVAARGAAPLMNLGVIARPTVSWSLVALLTATGTYYALLFTLAQYLQQGLGRSPFVSGLTLVPWVAAFGIAGQVVRRLPEHMRPIVPSAGCALLAAAYVAISAALFGDRNGEALLVVVLAAGRLGLGIRFSALIGDLANAVPSRYAPDISGVSTTLMQVGGTVGVAAFGTLYLALAGDGATHAFAVVTAAFAAAALLAAAAAYRSTASARPKW